MNSWPDFTLFVCEKFIMMYFVFLISEFFFCRLHQALVQNHLLFALSLLSDRVFYVGWSWVFRFWILDDGHLDECMREEGRSSGGYWRHT